MLILKLTTFGLYQQTDEKHGTTTTGRQTTKKYIWHTKHHGKAVHKIGNMAFLICVNQQEMSEKNDPKNLSLQELITAITTTSFSVTVNRESDYRLGETFLLNLH